MDNGGEEAATRGSRSRFLTLGPSFPRYVYTIALLVYGCDNRFIGGVSTAGDPPQDSTVMFWATNLVFTTPFCHPEHFLLSTR